MSTAHPFDVVVVGSANLDLVARTKRLPHPGETVSAHGYFEACGGKGANQAIAAARAGARTAFVGAIGDDAAGARLRKEFEENGVDTQFLHTLAEPTGRALIGVSDDAENLIIVVPGANHALTPEHLERSAAVLRDARVVLLQLEVRLDVVARAVALAGPHSLVVLNPAPAAVVPDEVLCRVDVLSPNEHEVEVLGGTESLLARGVKRLVVTEGARGARLVTRDAETRIAPYPVTPVDTTGAGDAFCGVLSARLALSGIDHLEEALRAAAVAGALSTQVQGAVPSLPRWPDIAAALSTM